MIQHILKQIWTQRRRNGWIFSELLLVFVLCWYIADYAFVMVHNRMIPNGYDITDTWQIVSGKNINDSTRSDFDRFLDKVKRFPGVQHIFATSDWGVTPFGGSYTGYQIQRDSTSTGYNAQTKRIGSNSYFDVFNIHSINTKQPARLFLSDYNTVMLTQNLAESLFGEESPIGKTVYFHNKTYRVTDVVENQKRFDYSQPGNVIFYPDDLNEMSSPEISIRTGSNFSLEQFKREVSSDIKSYRAIQRAQEFEWGITKEVRIRNGVMIFFLLNIALGVIGTFWFRNQTRRSEIGLRMAMGSSHRQIQTQYLIEALLILTLATIPAVFINIVILQADLIKTLGQEVTNSGYITANKWLRFLITNGITYILLAAIVAFSAWIPARQASKVHPVEALRDE
ncbi:putative ABC transport system permease protein [Porphyromonadaceae bacterium KH3CP3RA]|nr:putative ABC transport system permease protein [Porphyromonadaceae bacterium KH3CP3RA]